jgi:hypothetical protein
MSNQKSVWIVYVETPGHNDWRHVCCGSLRVARYYEEDLIAQVAAAAPGGIKGVTVRIDRFPIHHYAVEVVRKRRLARSRAKRGA